VFFRFTLYFASLAKPPDTVVGVLRFYPDSCDMRIFCHLPSELAERKSTKTGHMLGSECDLKMHVRNLGCSLLIQIGGPITTLFRRLCNLTTLTTDVFGTKDDIGLHIGQVHW